MPNGEWNSKGAALSDKSARGEYGLTQEQIIEAIRNGELQYRENHIHGNPYLRLLRREVEELIHRKHGSGFLERKKQEAELKSIKSEIRQLKTKMNRLEKRKAEILVAVDANACTAQKPPRSP